MATQITLEIRDDTYHYAEQLAIATGQSVSDILSLLIENTLVNAGPNAGLLQPVGELSDTEVLSLTDLKMEPQADQRQSELLQVQQARDLTPAEQAELRDLMRLYHHGLIRKAQVLREAVQRGLRGPLEP